ncbi:hypothetical protein [Massilia sp. YMA4]|uniref:hypothetical protein n=1 Tax=Massilia sp. YMA4 TaxID=1593482 RepID=UPI000DD10C9B|nr:hypothetical protein [Massilia sp. YMA4]AXA89800.1 hypothetical protein DPH57_00585 [Massilia sp. YMA4]
MAFSASSVSLSWSDLRCVSRNWAVTRSTLSDRRRASPQWLDSSWASGFRPSASGSVALATLSNKLWARARSPPPRVNIRIMPVCKVILGVRCCSVMPDSSFSSSPCVMRRSDWW